MQKNYRQMKSEYGKMLGVKLNELRQNHGFTQKQLAKLLNLDRSTYSYYESGKILPNILIIIELSKLYLVSCDYLIKDDINLSNITNINNLINKAFEK